MAEKRLPTKRVGNQVCIPVKKEGTVYDNFELLVQLIEDWKNENPTDEIDGSPKYHITQSSSGRGISINSITFSLK